jgi:hypothetical protein
VPKWTRRFRDIEVVRVVEEEETSADPNAARNFRRRKKVSRRLERKLAEEVGGRTQPASGAIPTLKDDVVSDKLRIEHKYTDMGVYVLKPKTFTDAARRSRAEGTFPILEIHFKPERLRFGIIETGMAEELGFVGIRTSLRPSKGSCRLTADYLSAIAAYGTGFVVEIELQGVKMELVRMEELLEVLR